MIAGVVFFAAASTTPAEAFSFGKKHKVEAPPPPPEPEIPVGPPVLASFVLDSASGYAAYMQSASTITAQFADGPSILAAIRQGVHSELHQMQQGEVAYAAIVALQDPTFVAAVREFGKHASTRDAVLRNILANPAYVNTLGGHESAAGLIMAALNAQGQRLKSAGQLVRQEAYDIQRHSKWSLKAVPEQPALLQDVKTLSSVGLTPPPDMRATLQQVSTGTAPLSLLSAPPAQAPYTEAVTRGMALAALAILGMAGDDHLDYVTPLLVNDTDAFCFNMSKLNLYQCLSVARPYYEDIYCLGLHAMMDTGQCVMTSAGEPAPVAPLTPATITTAAPVAATTSAAQPSSDLAAAVVPVSTAR